MHSSRKTLGQFFRRKDFRLQVGSQMEAFQFLGRGRADHRNLHRPQGAKIEPQMKIFREE